MMKSTMPLWYYECWHHRRMRGSGLQWQRRWHGRKMLVRMWGYTIKPKNIYIYITIYNMHLTRDIVPSALSYCNLHFCGSPIIFPSPPISCPSQHCNSVATNVATLLLLLPQLIPLLLPPLSHCWLLHCCQSSSYLVASCQTILIGETHGHSLNPG